MKREPDFLHDDTVMLELTPYQKMFYNEWLKNRNGSGYNIVIDQVITGAFEVDRLNIAVTKWANEHLLMNSNVKCDQDRIYWVKRDEISYADKIVVCHAKNLSDEDMLRIVAAPFDLENGLIFRAHVIRQDDDRCRMLLVFHHILIDASCSAALCEQILKNYNGRNDAPPVSLERQAHLHQQLVKRLQSILGENHDAMHDFWRRHLDDVAGVDLKFLQPSGRNPMPPGDQDPIHTAEIRFGLDEATAAKVKKLKRQYLLTPYMYSQAVFAILLHRLTGQQSFAISFPAAILEGKDLIYGAHLNSMAIDFRFVDGMKIGDVIGQSVGFYRELSASNAKYLPVYELARYAGSNDIFEVGFIQTDLKDVAFLVDGVVDVDIKEDFNVDFPHKLLFEQEAKGKEINYRVRYQSSIISGELVEQFVEIYKRLFREVLDELLAGNLTREIRDYDLLDELQYQRIVQESNDHVSAYPSKTIHGLFEDQAAFTPANTALVYGDLRLTYKELNERANQLAYYLKISYDLRPDDLVALCLERNEHMLISILAVLKAGAAYVPIDPHYPMERIGFILRDTGARVVLTNSLNRELMLQATGDAAIQCGIVDSDAISGTLSSCPVTNPFPTARPDNLFYIVYTSGTTQHPKGVMIEHRHVVNVVYAIREAYDFKDTARITAFTSFGFDVSSSEFFVSLLFGNELHLLGDELRADVNTLSAYLLANEIEYVYLPPVILANLPRIDYPNLKTIVYAGEPCDYDTGRYWSRNKRLFNYYGPTETNIATGKLICDGDVYLIGRPVANATAYVLDANRMPLPAGVIGELYLGGDSVARGFLNLPDLTEERFIANPFQTPAEKAMVRNAVLYKTGDLVRLTPSGDLEYIGRNDFQLKIRGFRIEPGEIESTLCGSLGIRQAVVLAKEQNDSLAKYLVAYYVSDNAVEKDHLVAHLSDHLPNHMVPSVFVHLNALPLTVNGKVDRKKLPDPGFYKEESYSAPEDEMQRQLCGIYAEALGMDAAHISIDADFFSLGGDSIMSIKLAGKISKAMNKTISIVNIFSCRTIRKLSAHLQTGSEVVMVIETSTATECELSFAQERLWFVEAYKGADHTYNIPVALKLDAATNVDSFIMAIKAVFKRHEVLRSLVKTSAKGVGYQEVQDDELRPLEVETFVCESRPDLHDAISRAFRYAFELDHEYPIQVKVYRLNGSPEDACVYVSIVIHHIAFDGWSANVMLNELISHYHYYELREGGRDYLPDPLRLQYKDFAAWQRKYLTGETLQNQLSYWKNKLSGCVPLNLVTDKKRPSNIQHEGRDVLFDFDASLSLQLRQAAKELEVSLYSLLLGGYFLMLHGFSNQDDIVVGTPVANRHHSGSEDTIGFFVNTVPLRQVVSMEESVAGFIKRVSDMVIETQLHQDLPFEKIVSELGLNMDTSRHPVFQVMFGVQHFGQVDSNEVRLFEHYQVDGFGFSPAKYDITTMLDDSGKIIRGTFNYAVSLFYEHTIVSFIDTYKEILRQIAGLRQAERTTKMVRELGYLNRSDYQKIVNDWNATAVDWPSHKLIHQLIEDQVTATSQNTAIVYEDVHLTYLQLNERANQLAAYLKAQFAVQPDDLVAICLERSELLLIAMLGVLKSGCAYIPVDPELPANRISFMLRDAKAKVLLVNESFQAKVGMLDIEGTSVEYIDGASYQEMLSTYPVADMRTGTRPGHLAYVMYTSGTTGKPKGVQVTHSNLVNFIWVMRQTMNLGPADRLLATITVSFDASVQELLLPLACGAGIVLVGSHALKDPSQQLEMMRDGITMIASTGSKVKMLLDAGWKSPLPLKVLTGGEIMTSSFAREVLPLCNGLWNLYGPTETTVLVTAANIVDSNLVSIGRPIGNTQLYVLDGNMRPLPVGAIGELYIGGAGVARGYLERPELTLERFVVNPFQSVEDKAAGKNATLYKTGDLVRYLPDGNVDYIGRNDHLVKINGYRIETGEIESVLCSMEGIRQAVVIPKERDTSGANYLVGYYVSDEPLQQDTVRSYLKKYLPEYMLPSVLVHIRSLPLTANQKIDRSALPNPEFTGLKSYHAPENETQQLLCDLFASVLELDGAKISIDDDFFNLGGGSLLSVKLLSGIKSKFSSNLSLADVFSARTVRRLSESVGDRIDSFRLITRLNDTQGKANVFMIHPGFAGCEVYFPLAGKLNQFSCFGVDSYNLYHLDQIKDLRKLATFYLSQIDEVQQETRQQDYTLMGWSLGGYIALEMAVILEERGVKNINIFLLDTLMHTGQMDSVRRPAADEELQRLQETMGNSGVHAGNYRRYFEAEADLQWQPISGKLKSTRTVLFKAMQSDDRLKHNAEIFERFIKKLEFNGIDNLIEYPAEISAVKLYNVNHWSILKADEIITAEVISRLAKHVLVDERA